MVEYSKTHFSGFFNGNYAHFSDTIRHGSAHFSKGGAFRSHRAYMWVKTESYAR